MADLVNPATSLQYPRVQQVDPIGLFSQISDLQAKQNQLDMFRNTFEARNRAGQILSLHAGNADPEAGTRALMADPMVMAFYPQAVSENRTATKTLLENQAGLAKQRGEAQGAFDKTLPSIWANPTMENWNAALSGAMLGATPEGRRALAQYAPILQESLFGGIPPEATPEQRQAIVANRIRGKAMASGFSREQLEQMFGMPKEIDSGGAITIGLTDPASGTFNPATVIGKSAAPSMQTVDLAPGDRRIMSVGGGGPTITQLGRAPIAGTPLGGSLGIGPMPGMGSSPVQGSAPSPVQGSAPIPGPGGIRVMSRAAEDDQKADVKAREELDKEISAGAASYATNMAGINHIRGLIQKTQFEPNGLAPIRRQLGEFTDGLQKIVGKDIISDQVKNQIANGSLDSNQAFRSAIATYALNQMKAAVQGTGRAMLPEVVTYMNAINEAQTPEALLKMLEQAGSLASLHQKIGQDWTYYKNQISKGKGPTLDGEPLKYGDFWTWWNAKHMKEFGLDANQYGTAFSDFAQLSPSDQLKMQERLRLSGQKGRRNDSGATPDNAPAPARGRGQVIIIGPNGAP